MYKSLVTVCSASYFYSEMGISVWGEEQFYLDLLEWFMEVYLFYATIYCLVIDLFYFTLFPIMYP